MGRIGALLLTAYALGLLSEAIALNLNAGQYSSLPEQTQSLAAPASTEDRILVVVLGHGQAERSLQLRETLFSFYHQLGPANFDCIVYVWNPHMVQPGLPPNCEVEVTQAVFMEYTKMIPKKRLAAAKYAYLMADDVTLNVPGRSKMNITTLRDLANANCLDVLTPAHFHGNYDFLAPRDNNKDAGRMLQFLEFQAVLVTPPMVRLLAKLAAPKITGCWGYDSLLYSAVQKFTGREPRIGIADKLAVNCGSTSLSNHDSVYGRKVHHPCGKIERKHGMYFHAAGRDQVRYWTDRGLADYTTGHQASVGRLVEPGHYGSISHDVCARMLTSGELALK